MCKIFCVNISTKNNSSNLLFKCSYVEDKKRCYRCLIYKDKTLFYKNNAAKDKLNYCCKDCDKICANKYNKDSKNKEKKKLYYKSEKYKESKKIYRQKNKKVISEKRKLNYIKNKEHITSVNNNWYRKNKDRKQAVARKYIKTEKGNSVKKKCLQKEYAKRKHQYHNDIEFRLKTVVRTSINSLFKSYLRVSEKEVIRTSRFLSYSFNDLKNHLESLFEPWMNWNNWRSLCPREVER